MNAPATDEIILYGFPMSTYVCVARLALHAKGLEYRFHDVENEIHDPVHLARHPFGRVPALQHADFWLYETSAIALYVEERFPGPRLLPADVRLRAQCHQWISNLNSYFYPYMIYYLVHERVVFRALGIPADEEVVAAALPKIEHALTVFENALRDEAYVVGDTPTLADYFLLPALTALTFTAEGTEQLGRCAKVRAWLDRMGRLPVVAEFRSTLPPFAPIEHARRWVTEHRPAVRRVDATPARERLAGTM
jgi:glutathione S-transferase